MMMMMMMMMMSSTQYVSHRYSPVVTQQRRHCYVHYCIVEPRTNVSDGPMSDVRFTVVVSDHFILGYSFLFLFTFLAGRVHTFFASNKDWTE